MEQHTRLGAWLGPQNCHFRVWAPDAGAASVVIQDGPEWEHLDPTAWAVPMAVDDGYWTATVPGVTAGQLYRFRLTTADGGVIERLDPAARDVLSSELTRGGDGRNGSVIIGRDPYPWADFVPPGFADLLIYQFHVGSFAGRGDQHDTMWATFGDVESKFGYLRELGFNCIEPLPIQEFAMDRSWGYNPASFFAPESSYGTPEELRHFVDAAHRSGLAVIFDVVYNHAGPGDNVLWNYDRSSGETGGSYFDPTIHTPWGIGPAWWRPQVQDFFYQNARMYLEEYRADGLRFDVTTQINGNDLKTVVWRLRHEFPDRYIVAEHLPDHPWIVREGGFGATWMARMHHELQRALVGQDPVTKVRSMLGWDGYDHSWNLVKYGLGSHDDIGDKNNGNAEDGLTNWDSRHRYFVDQMGGREDPTARAKCRLAWALTVTMPGTPLLFMGSECHLASPHVGWGYWNDEPDERGDHRFNWDVAGDPIGVQMRRLVAATNQTRWANPALRADSLDIPHEDQDNRVIGFRRAAGDNVVLVVANLGDRSFGGHAYGVATGGVRGRWTQVLCTQDADFGGWDGAGNAFHGPWTQDDGRVYLNVPAWSVVVLRRTEPG